MRTINILTLCILLCLFFGNSLNAQTCGPEPEVDPDGFEGSAFFNYGSTTRSKSNSYKTAFAVGQTFIGFTEGLDTNTFIGFYGRNLLPPFALKVKATQGDLLDRIQVTWEIDALGPSPNEGFNIYRDGIFLATVEANIRSYNDFNVIAGRPYTYTVRGVNLFGEGVASDAIGFQVPNGVVTGWISTLLGSPVPGASVTLTPMQGFSAKFEQGDGATAMTEQGTNPFLPDLDDEWTITFWMKTDASAINGKLIGMDSLFIRLRPGNTGLAVAKTAGGTAFLVANFPNNTFYDWHHVALTYDGTGNKYRLYFDGGLVAIATSNPVPPPDTINFGALAGTGTWIGRLDELRLYHHKLDELDFDMVMEGTASSETPYLTHYWKMDEELGVKSYDIVKRHKLYFCGAEFDADRPPVHTSAITNEEGYYKIESASYGTGITFLAKPKKNFFMHRALKFNKSESDYATLPDFAITKKATIELWVNSAGPDGFQCLLSKQFGTKEFRVVLDGSDGLNNYINVHLNGTTQSFTQPLGSGYQHLAFVWDSLSHTIKGFKNGALLATLTLPATTGNWSDPAQPWFLGRRPIGASSVLPFDGLIDEVAVYDTTLSQAIINNHADTTRDMQERGLRVYFPLDEGSGINISNVGSVLLSKGTTFGTEWSALASHQVIEPHDFTPGTRQVTLNPSVTSVDQVDFVDRSTIGVTGYVRYKDTDCFANNVEILVNGESFSPKIITDSTGKFVIDFDPGTSAILTPKFEDHIYTPAFWEVTNVSSPIAGIIFNDIITHNITVKVTGGTADGLCQKSILTNPGQPGGTVCRVKVKSVDDCYEQEITLNNVEGNWTFNNLPPLDKMTVAVTFHSVPAINTSFQDQGAPTVDISKGDTTVTFTYTAPPQVQVVEGLEYYSPLCSLYVFDQFNNETLKISLIEEYDGGVCPVDTANFHIINGFGDEIIDTVMSNGLLTYDFRVGEPNPTPPYLKTLEIVGTTMDGNDCEFVTQGLVTGIRAKDQTFTSLMPEIPSLILRDPPGDGSYSYLEKNEKFCTTTSVISEIESGIGGGPRIYIGGKSDWLTAPLGFGLSIEISNESFIGLDAQLTVNRTSANSFETCASFDSRISTSDQDLVVGGYQGGDLYMGSAVNIKYGNVDIVTLDIDNCTGAVEEAVEVQPGDFATTFLYSEYYIKNTMLPALNVLLNDVNATPEDTLRYYESIQRWEAILEYNEEQKQKARFLKNISFDAGIEYEYSETSDTTSTEELELLVNSESRLETDFKILVAGLGVGGNIRLVNNTSNGGKEGSGSSKGITTGYVLKDDDPLDAYSIDIGMDSVYKTPVFNIKAGQTSCPWEHGTAKREGVLLTSVDGPFRTDVPPNEPAVYHFTMGNISATNETWTYAFTAGPESNPHGAEIFCNGAPMNQIQWYAIPWGTSIPVTVTLERGPVEYDYDDLEIVLYSACEDQRANDLGILPDTALHLYSAVYISAHFIRPCSEVNIDEPRQDWVVTSATGNTIPITVSGYDTMNTDFKLIRLEYRPSDGDGAWIKIPGVSQKFNPNWEFYTNQTKLGKIFTQFSFNTTGFADGPYEIRALTECTGDATGKSGYSEIIKGRIDRDPPKLLGVPQPSDGVLQVGDEISFTFDQPIDCDRIVPVDDVKLYDATTNTLISNNFTCIDNKIIIDPLFVNEEYENHILRAELDTIRDLTGNAFKGTFLNNGKWEFFLDRNELAWLTDSAGITKYEDETKSIMVKMHNRGGYPVPFTIDAPDWVHVTPDAGTLVANEIRDIQFTAGDTLDVEWFKDSITLITENPFFMGGVEKLPFDVRNMCRPPDWVVNTALYQQTMTLCLRIKIDNGPFSEDPEDQIAAFIDGQLRGTAKLTKTNVPSPNTWVAFMTLYGNASDAGKDVFFELFIADACLHYPARFAGGDTITFTENGIQGTPGSPRTLINIGYLIHEIPVKTGWNWISFNLGFPNPAINQVLNNILNPSGDLIKNKTAFSSNVNNSWNGSLTTVGNQSMYMYQSTKNNTIKITGNALSPASVPITLSAGAWNWISYIPDKRIPINTALASITPTPTAGDVIKSQNAFAVYVNNTTKWLGSLTHLQSPNGYILKTASAGTLTYPASFTGDDSPITRNAEKRAFWNVDASKYEHNMTLIGVFEYHKANATTAGMELGAFVGDELRGASQAVYIDFLDSYMFFLTTLANKSGEQVHFKLYDSETGEILDLQEKMTFTPNYHQGSIEDPVPFSLQTTGIGDVQSELSFNVQPNPFRDETVCRIELPNAKDVRLIVSDLDGKTLYVKQIQANAGMNSFIWKGCSTVGTPLSNGIYLIRLETEHGVLTKKVVLQR